MHGQAGGGSGNTLMGTTPAAVCVSLQINCTKFSSAGLPARLPSHAIPTSSLLACVGPPGASPAICVNFGFILIYIVICFYSVLSCPTIDIGRPHSRRRKQAV